MSKPRYKWWSYVQWMVRLYPGRMEELRDMQSAGITANYSASPRTGEASRTTENLALSSLGDIDGEVEAVRLAIEDTKILRDGASRLRLIELYYWKHTHTMQGACDACHVSYRLGCAWHGDFIRAVARHFGLPMEKCAYKSHSQGAK